MPFKLFDGNWRQIGGNKTVTVSGPSNPPESGTAPARNPNPKFRRYENTRSSSLSVNNLTDYHLHMFYGNTKANARTTKSSLVNSGGGTCSGFELNRSAYWSPAVMDSKGNAVLPEQIVIYYKTSTTRNFDAKNVRAIPRGLKMLAGNTTNKSSNKSQHLFWSCGSSGKDYNKTNKIPNCGGSPINATVYFPQCWDGKNLDSADHKSHMYQIQTWEDCPRSHPVRLPRLGILLYYPAQSTAARCTPTSTPVGTTPQWIGGSTTASRPRRTAPWVRPEPAVV